MQAQLFQPNVSLKEVTSALGTLGFVGSDQLLVQIQGRVLHPQGHNKALALWELHRDWEQPGEQIVGLHKDWRRLEAHSPTRRGTTNSPQLLLAQPIGAAMGRMNHPDVDTGLHAIHRDLAVGEAVEQPAHAPLEVDQIGPLQAAVLRVQPEPEERNASRSRVDLGLAIVQYQAQADQKAADRLTPGAELRLVVAE